MIALVGHVVVDVTLPEKRKLRLGGICHAARALWALGETYALGWVAPNYLRKALVRFGTEYGARESVQIGEANGWPSVMLIGEPTEAGDQGYDLILRSELEVSYADTELIRMRGFGCSEWLLFPQDIDIGRVIETAQIDLANVRTEIPDNPDELLAAARVRGPFRTLISSTSTEAFRSSGTAEELKRRCMGLADELLLKENRGGSRLFSGAGLGGCVDVPAFPRPIQHSVGVGDAFNAAYAALSQKCPMPEALVRSSLVAAEYAATTYPEDFRAGVQAMLRIPTVEVMEMHGVLLPWEKRPKCQIYVAGPDFDYMDTTAIRKLEAALKYHNFSPRLPVREHGQAAPVMSNADRRRLGLRDRQLLQECDAVVALPLGNDPGTLVEIGLAAAMNKPCIVWDPDRRHCNPMLLATSAVFDQLDDVISHVFQLLGRNGGTS